MLIPRRTGPKQVRPFGRWDEVFGDDTVAAGHFHTSDLGHHLRLADRLAPGRSSWTAPPDALRLAPSDDAAPVAQPLGAVPPVHERAHERHEAFLRLKCPRIRGTCLVAYRLFGEQSQTTNPRPDTRASRRSLGCNVGGRSLTCAATYFNAVMWRFRTGSPGATFRAGTDAGRRSTTGSGFEGSDLHGSTSRRGDVSWLRGILPSSTSNGVVTTGRRRTMSSFSTCVCASTAV